MHPGKRQVYNFKHVSSRNEKHRIFSGKVPMEKVADPHWFNADPDTDPALFLIADPDPGFWWPKIEKILKLKKIAIYLSLGLYKGRPSYRRNFSFQKKASSNSKNMKFHYCFLFLLVIFPLLDPDPQSCLWSTINTVRHLFSGIIFYGKNKRERENHLKASRYKVTKREICEHSNCTPLRYR